jgi:hypothetical protein
MKRRQVHVRNPVSSTVRALTLLVAAIWAGDARAAQQSGGSFIWQVPIDRSPEDVALHPFVPHPTGGTGGGVAVVRASQWDLSVPLLTPPSFDEIVVIRTLDGIRANVDNYVGGKQMTAVQGASDLVDVGINISCSVLIGQRHDGSDPSSFLSFIDVVNLSNTYGPNGASCTLRWDSDPGFGFVNDVEINEALGFAVVNHKNEARVVDLLNPTTFNVGLPLVNDPVEDFADPTYQRNSVAVTRSTEPTASHRAVVSTCLRRLNDPLALPVFQVSVLDLTATGATEVLRYSPPALAAHEPFDLALSPNDQLAVVVADDAVALFDLTAVPPAHRGTDITTNGVVRDYANLTDALVVTDTYAVTLGAINGGADWQADVYAISSTGLTKVHTLTGVGQPHDIDRSSDGRVVVLRTTQHVVVIKNPLASPLARWDIPSPSNALTRAGNGLQYDSIVVSRKWGEGPSGGPQVVRQYAVVLARDPNPANGALPDTARVDVIDLVSTPPALVSSGTWWLGTGSSPAAVQPASLRMLPGGQMVSVCSVGDPWDQDPNTMPTNDLLAGTDAFVFDLRRQSNGDMIGNVFQCERTGWPHVSSDPMESIPLRSVSLSRNLTDDAHDGWIHTIEIIDP